MDIARLRWQCRRGMLELDLVFNAFLETKYSQLSTAEQNTFVQLLSCTDQELFSWLISKQTTPNDPLLLALINKIN